MACRRDLSRTRPADSACRTRPAGNPPCPAACPPLDNSAPRGSSGVAMPCWDIKIFDENDNPLPPGHEGEIVTRGPVMTGFYNKPEATAKIMRGGWLHTGDLGKLDNNGHLYITGRSRR